MYSTNYRIYYFPAERYIVSLKSRLFELMEKNKKWILVTCMACLYGIVFSSNIHNLQGDLFFLLTLLLEVSLHLKEDIKMEK